MFLGGHMIQFLDTLLSRKFRNAARTQYLDIIVYIQTKLHHMNKFLTGERCCLRRDEDFHVIHLSQSDSEFRKSAPRFAHFEEIDAE